MGSYYTIVQYVPDEFSDERINIGVLVYDEKRVQCRFLKQWQRVKCFAHHMDVSFLKDVASDFQEACSLQLATDRSEMHGRLTPANMSQVIEQWQNNIQLTEARWSSHELSILLPKISDLVLKTQPKAARPENVSRSEVKASVIRSLNRVIRTKFGPLAAQELIREDFAVPGKDTIHHVDVAIGGSDTLSTAASNITGSGLACVEAISFQGHYNSDLRNAQSAVSWAVKDIKDASSDTQIAVVAARPKRNSNRENFAEYDRFRRLITGYGAQIIEQDEVGEFMQSIENDVVLPKYVPVEAFRIASR